MVVLSSDAHLADATLMWHAPPGTLIALFPSPRIETTRERCTPSQHGVGPGDLSTPWDTLQLPAVNGTIRLPSCWSGQRCQVSTKGITSRHPAPSNSRPHPELQPCRITTASPSSQAWRVATLEGCLSIMHAPKRRGEMPVTSSHAPSNPHEPQHQSRNQYPENAWSKLLLRQPFHHLYNQPRPF